MDMLGLGSPRGQAVDPSTERSPPTPSTVMKAISNHELQKTEQFQRSIDKFMGVPSRTPDLVRLLPDPQFKIAQQSAAEQSKKRRYGSSEGRAQVECVKRIALGGKVTEVDARVVGVPRVLMQKQAEQVFATGRVEDTEDSMALSRTAARAAEVGHAAVYTEEEYDSCVVDALKKDRGTQKELSLKYGPSVTSMKRGMTHVRSHIKDTNGIVSDQECDRIIDALSDEELRVVLKTLRRNGIVQKMGGKCLLTDQEITAVLATVGVMGHTCVGTIPGTHRARIARAINEYGEQMLRRIEGAEQRGEYVDPKEKYNKQRKRPAQRQRAQFLLQGSLQQRARSMEVGGHVSMHPCAQALPLQRSVCQGMAQIHQWQA